MGNRVIAEWSNDSGHLAERQGVRFLPSTELRLPYKNLIVIKQRIVVRTDSTNLMEASHRSRRN